MHTDNVDTTAHKFLKKQFQPGNKINLWRHVNTNVYITAFMLLAP